MSAYVNVLKMNTLPCAFSSSQFAILTNLTKQFFPTSRSRGCLFSRNSSPIVSARAIPDCGAALTSHKVLSRCLCRQAKLPKNNSLLAALSSSTQGSKHLAFASRQGHSLRIVPSTTSCRFLFTAKKVVYPGYRRNRKQYRQPIFEKLIVALLFVVPVVVVVFILYHSQNKVVISGRRRFLFESDLLEQQLSEAALQVLLAQFANQICQGQSEVKDRIRRISKSLIAVSGDERLQNLDWDYYVIEEETPNAMVLPAGKVIVFTGLLKIAEDNDELATILSHEISHVLARHGLEHVFMGSMTKILLFAACFMIGIDPSSLFSTALMEFLAFRPLSRKLEKEADYIGLILMARAGYDLEKAVFLWRKMLENEKGELHQFLSTHPMSSKRAEYIESWIPEARVAAEQYHLAQKSAL